MFVCVICGISGSTIMYTYRFLPASGHFSEALACIMEITSKARACPFSPWEQCFKGVQLTVHAWETHMVLTEAPNA